MSVMMRKTFPNARFSLRMGCGEQLLSSDSLSSADLPHRELERCHSKSSNKGKAERGRGE